MAIVSPLHAIRIVPPGAVTTSFPVGGVWLGEADDVVVLVGDAEPDAVGVVLGAGVVLAVAVGVAEGVRDADGEVPGITAPPTALPARHT